MNSISWSGLKRCWGRKPSRFTPLPAGLAPTILKKILLPLQLLLLPYFLQAADPPNFVLILIDDMGWRDVGFAGSALAKTPHIDALAGKGLIFRQAYSSAPNCAPSRA